MEPTEKMSDPVRFWTVAASLGGQLANEGMERADDPLVWVAALEMAKEALLAAGGEAFVADWNKAQRGRQTLAARGTTFHIEAERESESGRASKPK
jgi:hypothetical protein